MFYSPGPRIAKKLFATILAKTNFGWQDKIWSEFSTLEVAIYMTFTNAAVQQNGLA